MNNSQFDNKYSNRVVMVIGTIIRMIERSFITFFDGMRSALQHGSPSLVSLFATLSPIIAPLPMAAMTSIHLMEYLAWKPWQAILLAASLELVGFPLWVYTTEAIFIDGWKGTSKQIWLVGSTAVYEVILISINVFLVYLNGTGDDIVARSVLFFLVCLIPALCGVAYSYNNRKSEAALAKEKQEMVDAQARAEQIEIDAKIRAEQSAERITKYGMKHGASLSPAMATLNSDTPQVRLNQKKSDWRQLTEEEQREVINVLQPSEITTRYAVSRSTAFAWKKKSL